MQKWDGVDRERPDTTGYVVIGVIELATVPSLGAAQDALRVLYPKGHDHFYVVPRDPAAALKGDQALFDFHLRRLLAAYGVPNEQTLGHFWGQSGPDPAPDAGT